MEAHEFDGVTICVRRKDAATVCRYPDVVEVVVDHEAGSGQKWLLLKKRNAAVGTDAMMLSEKVDEWWPEQSARSLLEEIARNKKGILMLREVMGAAGEVARHRAKVVNELVRDGLAIWVNSRRTIAKITRPGLHSLKE